MKIVLGSVRLNSFFFLFYKLVSHLSYNSMAEVGGETCSNTED